jgi:Ca2+-binding EF-hand superfamily protein
MTGDLAHSESLRIDAERVVVEQELEDFKLAVMQGRGKDVAQDVTVVKDFALTNHSVKGNVLRESMMNMDDLQDEPLSRSTSKVEELTRNESSLGLEQQLQFDAESKYLFQQFNTGNADNEDEDTVNIEELVEGIQFFPDITHSVEVIREKFEIFDEDHSGSLNFDEFKKLRKSLFAQQPMSLQDCVLFALMRDQHRLEKAAIKQELTSNGWLEDFSLLFYICTWLNTLVTALYYGGIDADVLDWLLCFLSGWLVGDGLYDVSARLC